jgi:hypothetical protein
MSTFLASRPPAPTRLASLTALDDGLSLSLDDFPDLPGSGPLPDEDTVPLAEPLLAWSAADDLRRIHVSLDDPIVNELPGEWQQPSEPLF